MWTLSVTGRNRNKTPIVPSDDGVKFLGVEIASRYTRIQGEERRGLKRKVKQLTRRNGGRNLARVMALLKPLLRGFAHYFGIANCSGVFDKLSGWIRRRLRAVQLRRWKKAARLHRRLKQLAYKPLFRFIKTNSWRNSASPLSSFAMPNQWFNEMRLYSLAENKTGWLVSSVPGWA